MSAPTGAIRVSAVLVESGLTSPEDGFPKSRLDGHCTDVASDSSTMADSGRGRGGFGGRGRGDRGRGRGRGRRGGRKDEEKEWYVNPHRPYTLIHGIEGFPSQNSVAL